MQCDILIRGGHVIDPSQELYGKHDVAVLGEKILAVSPEIRDVEANHEIDARGLTVVPGLIDLHMHAYMHTPFGLDPDLLCASEGVTTMLDAGSAGSYNFDAFRRDGIDRSRTELLALVNLSCIGLAAGTLGELLDRRYADPDGVIATIKRHPGVAVGVKIRAGKHIIGEGDQAWANLNDAVRAARETGTWLMVHIGDCPMPVPEICGVLEKGDCITHCFKADSTRITDDEGNVFDEVWDAAERGVIFDVGHGFGSFDWEVLEAALEQGFEPTTISTDLHTRNIHGPVYGMPTTMSKLLLSGVSMKRVVEMSTSRPARILKKSDQLGTLREGTIADIAILEKHEGRFDFTDSYGKHRQGEILLTAAETIRRGELLPGGGGLRMRRFADD